MSGLEPAPRISDPSIAAGDTGREGVGDARVGGVSARLYKRGGWAGNLMVGRARTEVMS